MEEDEALYKTQFASYIATDFGADDMEEKMAAVHEAIRADPSPSEKYQPPANLDKTTYRHTPKKSYEQRKADLKEKKERLLQEMEEK